MSVVAVKINKKTIDIAADSILTRGDWTKTTNQAWHKLTQVNDIIIGAVGDAEEASLFMHYCSEHNIARPTEQSLLAFMCEFAQWKLKMTNDSSIDNEYIILYDGKAFEVSSLFVQEITDYDAIGAGQDYALAALYLGHTPEEAVEVSCKLNCYVSEPIISYSMER